MVSEQIQSPVRYPSDLIDEEWEIIEAIISELDPYTIGQPRTYLISGSDASYWTSTEARALNKKAGLV
jgi:hypothetical protein